MILKFIKKYKFYLIPPILVIPGIIEYFNYFFVILTLWIIIKHPKIVFDSNLVLLSSFMMFYNFSTGIGGPVGRIFLISTPLAFYMYGKYITVKLRSESEYIALLLVVIIVFTILPMLSYVNNILDYGFDFSSIQMVGSDKSQKAIAGTLFTSYFALSISLFPFMFYKCKNADEAIVRKISIILSVIAIIIIGSIGQRTGFFILMFSVLYFLIITKYKLKFVSFMFVLWAIFIIISGDWFSGTNLYYKFFQQDKGTGVLSTRTEIWEAAANEFFDNPYGNKKLEKIGGKYSFAHNLWLDVGLRGGYISFFILIIFNLKYLVMIAGIRKRGLISPMKFIIFFLTIAFFSTFMVEPIMQGYKQFFNLFVFVFGVFTGVKK